MPNNRILLYSAEDPKSPESWRVVFGPSILLFVIFFMGSPFYEKLLCLTNGYHELGNIGITMPNQGYCTVPRIQKVLKVCDWCLTYPTVCDNFCEISRCLMNGYHECWNRGIKMPSHTCLLYRGGSKSSMETRMAIYSLPLTTP